MRITPITAPSKDDDLKQGRFRNPLPLSDGRLIASHTSNSLPTDEFSRIRDLRLRFLQLNTKSAYFEPGPLLTAGIIKQVSWFDGQTIQTYHGELWELEAVEVRPRFRPYRAESLLAEQERSIFIEEKVDELQFRRWLTDRNLALIITRDQTSRDRAERQQPFNLRVPGGVKTVAQDSDTSRVYDIQHFQIVQAEQVRGYEDRPGRRNLAQPIKNFNQYNPTNHQVTSSVLIAKDGSTAAFVPAARALSWQSTDAVGNPIVRERNWVTFRAGEIRTCTACHGVNTKNQAGLPPPTNKPEALRDLLRHWKNLKAKE